MKLCKNCAEPVALAYCPSCGQSARIGRISLSGLLRDLPHAIFHVDRGFLFNFNQFFRRPGPAILDYLAGKRKPYFHPATFLVISLLLNYVVVKITDLHFFDEHELEHMDPVAAKAIMDYDAMQWWFLEHTYAYILLAIPLSGLFLYLIFKWGRQHFNVAETTVIVLFTIAQGVLIQTMIYLVSGWVDSGPFLRAVEMINICILNMYATYVMYQLLPTVVNKPVRVMLSLFGGIGLAVIWMASAYGLYLVLT